MIMRTTILFMRIILRLCVNGTPASLYVERSIALCSSSGHFLDGVLLMFMDGKVRFSDGEVTFSPLEVGLCCAL